MALVRSAVNTARSASFVGASTRLINHTLASRGRVLLGASIHSAVTHPKPYKVVTLSNKFHSAALAEPPQEHETIHSLQNEKVGKIEISKTSAGVSIQTPRLMMRSLNQYPRSELVKNYHELLGNPDNVELFRDGKPWSVQAVESFIDAQTKRWELGSTFGTFTVFLNGSNTYVGSLNSYYVEDGFSHVGQGHPHVVEIGYFIDNRFWGKGYGTEIGIVAKLYIEHFSLVAKDIIMESGKQKPVPTEIVATVHPDNKPSIKILERTLSEKEDLIFAKTNFNGKPRVLFFHKLPTNMPNTNVDHEVDVIKLKK